MLSRRAPALAHDSINPGVIQAHRHAVNTRAAPLGLHCKPQLQRRHMLGPQVERIVLGGLPLQFQGEGCAGFFDIMLGGAMVAGVQFAARQQPRGITQFFALPLAPQDSK